MSSRDGFARADIDVGLLDDPKMKRLWRILGDETKMARAVVVYLSVVLGSWEHAERVDHESTVPMWLDPDAEIMAALRESGLLVEGNMISEESFEAWIVSVMGRVAKRRDASAAAHEARWGTRRNASAVRSDAIGMPSQPASQPARARPRDPGAGAPARHDGETLKAFLERIGAPIPDVAKETNDNGTDTTGEGHDRKPRRRRSRRGQGASG